MEGVCGGSGDYQRFPGTHIPAASFASWKETEGKQCEGGLVPDVQLCKGFRATASAGATSERVEAGDLGCTDTLPPTATGYCECASGMRVLGDKDTNTSTDAESSSSSGGGEATCLELCKRWGCWTELPAVNAIKGLLQEPGEVPESLRGLLFFFGQLGEDVGKCQDECARTPECAAYTLFSTTPTHERRDWAGLCYGRTEEKAVLVSDSGGTVSGVRGKCGLDERCPVIANSNIKEQQAACVSLGERECARNDACVAFQWDASTPTRVQYVASDAECGAVAEGAAVTHYEKEEPKLVPVYTAATGSHHDAAGKCSRGGCGEYTSLCDKAICEAFFAVLCRGPAKVWECSLVFCYAQEASCQLHLFSSLLLSHFRPPRWSPSRSCAWMGTQRRPHRPSNTRSGPARTCTL